jgi:hypothetical protein
MFVCTIPVAAIVTGIGMALAAFLATEFDFKPQSGASYVLLLLLSPGMILGELISPYLHPTGWLDLGGFVIAILGNFIYWFVWIFWFALRSDRRWRRKRRPADDKMVSESPGQPRPEDS